MTDFEKARLYYVLVFFGLLLPQMVLNYFIVTNPAIAFNAFNALHIETYGLDPLRTIGRALLLFQALNCLVLAEKTRIHGSWKWLLVLGVFLFGFVQWIALAILLLQRAKIEKTSANVMPGQTDVTMPIVEASSVKNEMQSVAPVSNRQEGVRIKKVKLTKAKNKKTTKSAKRVAARVGRGIKKSAGVKKRVTKKH